jgi:branched-chain amino acid transport system permease protein
MAIREDEDSAEAVGVAAARIKMLVLGVSAFFVALGGSFFASYQLYINPDLVYESSISIQMIVVTIVGGIGTLLGPVLGSLVIVPLSEYFRGVSPVANLLIYGLFIVVVMLFLPEGTVNKVRDLLARRGHQEAQQQASIRGLDEMEQTRGLAVDANALKVGGAASDSMPLLQVKELTRRFGGVLAVNRLDLAVARGDIVGLIGPNGAGKTTVFNLLTGFLRPDRGSILFQDVQIAHLSTHKICLHGMVRTFQLMRPFPRLTVYQNVIVGALARTPERQRAEQYTREALEFVGLAAMANRLPEELPIGHLKMLELAKALATKPQLLLLDEPYAGLNPYEGRHLGELLLRIHESGVTIILIEHVMRVVMALCNRIVVLHHGEKIAEGTAEKVANDPAVITAYLGKSYAGS